MKYLRGIAIITTLGSRVCDHSKLLSAQRDAASRLMSDVRCPISLADVPYDVIIHKIKMIKFLIFLCVVMSVSLEYCSEEETLQVIREPLYNFSMRFLDKVYFETAGHFVYSPMATWLQLISLAERASSNCAEEIWTVTGLNGDRKMCYRRVLREILNSKDEDLTPDSERSNLEIVDKYYRVNKKFKREVEDLSDPKAFSFNVGKPELSAKASNDLLDEDSEDKPKDTLNSFLYMTDAVYFKFGWRYLFNDKETKLEDFYSETGISIGKVNMINLVGYFNYAEIPLINAHVLEIPSTDEKVSMLIYLSIKNTIQDIFYLMQKTKMSIIFDELKNSERVVNVSLPRFEIVTDISNIKLLLYEMGITNIFYPYSAERDVSGQTLDVSLITQSVAVEVTEKGVSARSGPETIQTFPSHVDHRTSEDILKNEPTMNGTLTDDISKNGDISNKDDIIDDLYEDIPKHEPTNNDYLYEDIPKHESTNNDYLNEDISKRESTNSDYLYEDIPNHEPTKNVNLTKDISKNITLTEDPKNRNLTADPKNDILTDHISIYELNNNATITEDILKNDTLTKDISTTFSTLTENISAQNDTFTEYSSKIETTKNYTLTEDSFKKEPPQLDPTTTTDNTLIKDTTEILVTENPLIEETTKKDVLKEEKKKEVVATQFSVSKPFAFMLVDKTTGIVLFAGVYSEPVVF